MNRFAVTCLGIFVAAILIGSFVARKRGFDDAMINLDERAWLTDASAALAKAKAENKTVLLDFTGSDWCVWCRQLDREVFSSTEFKNYAEKNLVLVKLDFPQRKPQSAEIKRQNQALAEQYRIEGFPTIVVLDANGRQVGVLGYVEGGPAPWLAELEKITKG